MTTLTDRFAALRVPVVGAPMFLVSNPSLVIAQCRAGVIGSVPSLNVRTVAEFDAWARQITCALDPALPENADRVPAPWAVNLIVTAGNSRLEADLDVCERYRVPVIITSVGRPGDIAKRVHAWGGHVLHDVGSVRHARNAAEAGVDGIVAVCAGAGGHTGTLSPFAFTREIRRFFDGAVILAGAIGHGADVLAAQTLGADAAYMGTRFLECAESEIDPLYTQMLIAAGADDIVLSNWFSGMRANYLAQSVQRAGLDPATLPEAAKGGGSGGHGEFKAWRDIWSAGHGVGSTTEPNRVAALVDDLAAEYHDAIDRASSFGGRRQ